DAPLLGRGSRRPLPDQAVPSLRARPLLPAALLPPLLERRRRLGGGERAGLAVHVVGRASERPAPVARPGSLRGRRRGPRGGTACDDQHRRLRLREPAGRYAVAGRLPRSRRRGDPAGVPARLTHAPCRSPPSSWSPSSPSSAATSSRARSPRSGARLSPRWQPASAFATR